MNILIAMDSFKGNLTSLGVAGLVETGIKKVIPKASVIKAAVADGGEGTIDALLEAKGGRIITLNTTDPLGRSIIAKYAILSDNTAVVETAQASGLALLKKEERDPCITSTYGTGLLIKDAIENNKCNRIVIGAGGSATNDGGVGIAAALGVRFLDKEGKEVKPIGKDLDRITKIDTKDISDVRIDIVTDVTNLLLGEFGASRVYGLQKGASDDVAKLLDSKMSVFSQLLYDKTGIDIANIPGTGAAGGIGASLIALFGAKIQKGIEYILDAIDLSEKISRADIVITGEGRMDSQTSYGKLPVGIASLAKKFNKPVYAIAGFLDKGYEKVYEHGIDAAFSSMVGPMDLEEAIKESPKLIEMAAENLFRVIVSSMAKNNKTLGGGGINHIAIKVSDFDSSVDFYKNTLGFIEYMSWGSGDSRAIMLDTGDGGCLEIFAGGGKEKKQEGRILHFALNCDKIDEIIEKVRAKGLRITLEPKIATLLTPAPKKIHLAFFEGPGGELIELIESVD